MRILDNTMQNIYIKRDIRNFSKKESVIMNTLNQLFELAKSVEEKSEELSHDAKLLRMMTTSLIEAELEVAQQSNPQQKIWKISY